VEETKIKHNTSVSKKSFMLLFRMANENLDFVMH
jgi:hypothetical protein